MKYLTPFRNCLIPVCTLFVLSGLFSANLSARSEHGVQVNPYQNNQQIRHAAKIFLEKTLDAADNSAIEIIIGKIDPRLRLRRCQQDLQTSLLNANRLKGKTTIIVSCSAPVAWKVFVSAKTLEFAEVVVATRTINRHATISSQDVELKRVEISNFRKRPITELSHVVGTNAKRQIRRDKVIFENLSCLICKGEKVQIIAQNRFFNINLEAIALADASIGEITPVRNAKSKRIFNALVTGKNQLKVQL